MALFGGALLVWAAVRARSHGKVVGWSLAVAVDMLVGGQALAVVPGAMVVYAAALVVMAVAGSSLARALFRRSRGR